MNAPPAAVVIHRNRTNRVTVRKTGTNFTGATIAAQIRVQESATSTLLASFTPSLADAATGVIYLDLDLTGGAFPLTNTHGVGFTDVKVDGAPLFDQAVKVVFRDLPTA